MADTSKNLWRAVSLIQANELGAGEQVCQAMLAVDANDANAWHLLGTISLRKQQWSSALEFVSRAIEFAPDAPEPHNTLGLVLVAQERFEEAAVSFRRAVSLAPDFAEAHSNLGNVLQKLGRIDDAICCFRQALAIRPQYAKAHLNLGNALRDHSQLEEAAESFRRAVGLQPDLVEARNNLGLVLAGLRKLDDADECYRETMASYPDYTTARWNRALLMLLRGDLERGWREYEWRWTTGENPPRVLPEPLWHGEPLDGRTILLHCEQGIGDTFHFIRYAPLVKQFGGRVVVICQPAVSHLLKSCQGIDQLLLDGEPLPPFDCHAPLLSLPRILGTKLESIPAQVPYLGADPQLVSTWRQKLRSVAGFRVGINWHGQQGHKFAIARHIPLAEFAVLRETPGVRFISLQKGRGEKELANMRDPLPIFHLGDGWDTVHGAFMDTAAIMMNLDLVITSDTSIAHLAGALAVPVWVALPYVADWRWLLDRSDSPWYPTMRLFRQPSPGDWTSVFAEISAALRERLSYV